MFATDELYPPAQYAWGWLVLAIGLIALSIGIAWLVLHLTRARVEMDPAHTSEVPLASSEVLARLRTEYLGAIDHVEQTYRSGNMTPREANLALSSIIRTYVNEYSGLEAPVLALDDLERMKVHPVLIDAVKRHYYPGSFRRDRTVDPLAGAEAARRVVTTWH